MARLGSAADESPLGKSRRPLPWGHRGSAIKQSVMKVRVRTAILVATAVAAGAAALFVAADWWSALPEGLVARYTGSEACAECHEEEYRLWLGSDHELAMELATPKTVLGDFNGAEYLHVAFADLGRLSDEALRLVASRVPARQWALALHEADRRLVERVRQSMSPEQAEQLEAEQRNPVPVRPCDVTMAQRAVANVVRQLDREGKIHVDFGVRSKMFRRGDRFFIITDNREGQLEEFPIKYTFGVRPLQQYLVEMPDGRIQCLAVAWDTERREWFHVYGAEAIPHDDQLHWTGPRQNWNYMCAECHTTDLQKNYDPADNSYHTTWLELGVGCEACHGPGSIHIELARSRSIFWDRRYRYGLVDLKSEDPRVEIETCAPCHARRELIYPGFQAGTKFLDHWMLQLLPRPAWLEDEVYYPDGQVLAEDYVYGSFIQSRMYHEQVRCTDCHDPHSARVKYKDNRLCGQCHLPTTYDTPSHHHHPDPDKPGTLCVECHMPETTYMAADPRRDHSLRIPRPDLTVDLGIPNACNLCHHDPAKGETPEWAAHECRQWYGEPKGPEPFAYAFAAARQGKPQAESKLAAVAQRKDLSAMIRASAILELSQYRSGRAEAAAFLGLEDADGLVRAAAVRALGDASPEDLRRRVLPLVEDPLRAVRSEAARVVSRLPSTAFSAPQRRAFQRALKELLQCQEYLADQPGSHLIVGVIRRNLVDEQLRQLEQSCQHDLRAAPQRAEQITRRYHQQVRRLVREAEEAYRTALRVDPQFVPARMNLALLVYEYGDKAEAERLYREAIRLAPDFAEAYYSLGLLLAEDPQRAEETAQVLLAAAQRAPDHPRIRYNTGLGLVRLERFKEAEEHLLAAYRAQPQSADFLYALADLYIKTRRWNKAAACLNQLIRLQPGHPQWRLLLARVRAEAQRQSAQEPPAGTSTQGRTEGSDSQEPLSGDPR